MMWKNKATLRCKVCGSPLFIGKRDDTGEWVIGCSAMSGSNSSKPCISSPFLFDKDLEKVIQKFFEVNDGGMPPIYEIDGRYSFMREYDAEHFQKG
jgi:hypothetical protein